MASATLLQRLQAELGREGKKTALLGLLLLVGLWFWLPPLYRRLFGTAQAKTAAATEKADWRQELKPAAPAAKVANKDDSEQRNVAEWQVRRERLENLTILQPADWNEHLRDPFDSEWIDRQLAKRKPVEAVKPKPAVELSKVRVSSTVVGPGLKAAIINDQIYKLGDRFPREPTQPLPTLTIVDIQPNCVVFEHEGKRYTVRLE